MIMLPRRFYFDNALDDLFEEEGAKMKCDIYEKENTYHVDMARTSYPHSATSQFYINVADNDFLNADQASDGNGYCVFGTVVKGADVVDKIAAVRTTSRRGMNDVPVDVVKIVDVKVLP